MRYFTTMRTIISLPTLGFNLKKFIEFKNNKNLHQWTSSGVKNSLGQIINRAYKTNCANLEVARESRIKCKDKCNNRLSKFFSMNMEDSGIDSDPKNPLAKENGFNFQGNFSDSSSSSNNVLEFSKDISSWHLHKKLEERIQEAKKLQKTQEQKKVISGPNLIPIQRLSIPSKSVTLINKENFPLVDWDTEESDEDIHFFPAKPPMKQELTDTFSIEEFQISPDEDDLNLLPPKAIHQRISICCFSINSKCSIL